MVLYLVTYHNTRNSSSRLYCADNINDVYDHVFVSCPLIEYRVGQWCNKIFYLLKCNGSDISELNISPSTNGFYDSKNNSEFIPIISAICDYTTDNATQYVLTHSTKIMKKLFIESSNSMCIDIKICAIPVINL